jgi:hypothetical protein
MAAASARRRIAAMDRDLTGPDRHRWLLDPPRTRAGPPWPESADSFRPCLTATPTPTSTTRALSPPGDAQADGDRLAGQLPSTGDAIARDPA